MINRFIFYIYSWISSKWSIRVTVMGCTDEEPFWRQKKPIDSTN